MQIGLQEELAKNKGWKERVKVDKRSTTLSKEVPPFQSAVICKYYLS
jgi:hypothetical protein